MPTLAQLEQQIFDREGFRVKLTPFKENEKRYAAYVFPVMTSNRWRLSEWKAVRLAAYVTQIRGIVVLRGDGSAVRSDVRIGPLRDGYFEAEYPAEQSQAQPLTNAKGNVLEFKAPAGKRWESAKRS